MQHTIYLLALSCLFMKAVPTFALELPLAVHTEGDDVLLVAMSPLNDRGDPFLNIGVSDRLEANVHIENQFIQVIADILPPSGEIYLPAFREFVHSVPIGSLPSGAYTLEYRLFSAYSGGDLVGRGTTSISVVPEPSAVLLAAIACVGTVMRKRW